MLKPRRQDPLDLTGDWLGLYSYPGEAPPVPFRARLDEVGGDLSGHTLETVATSDKTERTLDANLAGRREGRAVTFLKTYRGSAPGYDAVAYTGDVSADGAEVDGRWTIAGRLSGPFLLIRAGDAAVYGAAVASARA